MPIQALDQKTLSNEIYALFQKSYRIEGELARAKDFPPLLWTPEMIAQRPGTFFGSFDGDSLVASIEAREKSNVELAIASLVVHPDHFKKGLATQLLNFALQKYRQTVVFVETAAANDPAISLYKKFGFQKVDTYVADFNIEKMRLVLNR